MSHVAVEFFTFRKSDASLSDYLTDLKLHKKNCFQWGLNSQPPDNQSGALTTELSHYLVVGVNH